MAGPLYNVAEMLDSESEPLASPAVAFPRLTLPDVPLRQRQVSGPAAVGSPVDDQHDPPALPRLQKPFAEPST